VYARSRWNGRERGKTGKDRRAKNRARAPRSVSFCCARSRVRARCIIELELIYNDTNRRVAEGCAGKRGKIRASLYFSLHPSLSLSLSLSRSPPFSLFSSRPSRRPTHSRSIVAGGGGTFLPGEVGGRVHRKAGRSGTRARTRARLYCKRVQLASDPRRCESRSPLPSCFGGIACDGTHHIAHRTHTYTHTHIC
jgi:hypothetical protein